jgi:hypothetical protein
MTDVICRLLASGMSADEVAMVLCVKAETAVDAAANNRQLIAKYSEQLKGRRQRAKKRRAS